VTDDPREREAIFAAAEAAMTRLVGAAHPQTLRLAIRRGMWVQDLGAARALFASTCETYDRFHPVLAATVIDCWAELSFVMAELGDIAGAQAALARVAGVLAAPENATTEAAGYLPLWRGDAKAAAAAFAGAIAASPPPGADEPWWLTFERGRLRLGLGRAQRAAGDAAHARATLESAIDELEVARRAQPAARVYRRLARGRVELSLALAATSAATARIAEVAAAAAAMLRSEGGRAAEIADLERAADR
jgi:tetratricopeptide (TPR) repeat protein